MDALQKQSPMNLTASTMLSVNRFFHRETDHRPSAEVMDALAEIPAVIDDMYHGDLDPRIFVSPLDCGVGKTTVLAHAIKGLISSYDDAGVIICIGQRDMIYAAIVAMNLDEKDFAVLVADGHPLNELGLGKAERDKAPVLFTTHAMVETRLVKDGGLVNWSDAEDFFYKGKPRTIKIWDESIYVRKGLSLTGKNISLIRGAIGSLYNHLAHIQAMLDDPRGKDQVIEFPLVSDRVSKTDAVSAVGEQWQHLVDTMWKIEGKPIRIVFDQQGAGCLEYETNLPDDMKPVLVLDASARVRKLYDLQQKGTMDVVVLDAAVKDYSNVQVFMKSKPGGRGWFMKKNNRDTRAQEVADVINANPDRTPLVIYHKDADGFEEMVTELTRIKEPGVKQGKARSIAFMTWGMHTSTNDHNMCDLVIAATTYRRPFIATTSLGRAAKAMPVDQHMERDEANEMQMGEVMHDLLQGLSRGTMRNLDGNMAQECLLYLVDDKRRGLFDHIQTLFPGCQEIEGWTEIDKYTPKQVELIQLLTKSDRDEFTGPQIAGFLDKDKSNIGAFLKSMAQFLPNYGWEFVPGKRGSAPAKVVKIKS